MARRRRVDPEQKAPKGPLPKGWRKGVIWRDPAYYEVLSTPEMIVALVALILGESRARDIDLKKLQFQPTRHVGDQLEQRYADLLVRIRYKRPADGGAPRPDTYLLVEFQSTVDPFMAVRLWGQLALVYRGLTLKRRSLGRKRLPAIVPIVIYTGRRRWTACRELSDMIEDDGTRRPLQLSYELLDAWRAGSQPAGDNLLLLLFRLERGEGPADLLESTKALRRRVTALDSKQLDRACTLWLQSLFGERVPYVKWEEYEDMQSIEGKLEQVSKVWTDQWEANALRKGRKEGRKEGQEQLKLLTASLRKTLRETVRGRFGEAVAAAFAKSIARVRKAEKLIKVFALVATSENGDELLKSVRSV